MDYPIMISTAPLYNPAKYGKAESITWMSLQHAVAMLSLTTSPPSRSSHPPPKSNHFGSICFFRVKKASVPRNSFRLQVIAISVKSVAWLGQAILPADYKDRRWREDCPHGPVQETICSRWGIEGYADGVRDNVKRTFPNPLTSFNKIRLAGSETSASSMKWLHVNCRDSVVTIMEPYLSSPMASSSPAMYLLSDLRIYRQILKIFARLSAYFSSSPQDAAILVMVNQTDLVKIVTELSPVAVIKG